MVIQYVLNVTLTLLLLFIAYFVVVSFFIFHTPHKKLMFNTSSTSLEINNMHGTNNSNAVHKNQILKPNINHVYDNNDINDKIPGVS